MVKFIFASLAAICAAAGLASASAVAPVPLAASAPNSFAQTLLDSHNQERRAVGVPALRWSPKLAREARQWAKTMASEGRMYHSTNTQRGGAGENLWRGSKGYYTANDMMNAFLSERDMFRAGNFPDVSTTGKWADVGHYTQIIWPSTTEVGCAIVPGVRDDFLACRYWPAGNWIGQPVGN